MTVPAPSRACPDCGAEVPLRCGEGLFPNRVLECPACAWRFYLDPEARVSAIREMEAALENQARDNPKDDVIHLT